MPVDADAPPDLVMPFTSSAAAFRLERTPLQFGGRRHRRIEQIEIGKVACQQRRIGKADIFIVGRDARHRHRALRKPRDVVAADIVGGNHRLPLADEYAQADIVAFRTLRLLDLAVAHFDALRHAAHRDRVRRIGAGAPGRIDETLGQFTECGLIEQVGVGGFGRTG